MNNLEITHSFGHGNNSSINHIQDSVLLEYGSQHRLHNNAWSRITDEAAFLMQLFGE